MPILRAPKPPKRKYSLLSTLLFSGWTFRPGESSEKHNRLIFEKAGYVFGLLEKEVILFPPGYKEGIIRPYCFLAQAEYNPGLIFNISKNLESFDLRDPEKGLQPAIEVHRRTVFHPMRTLLREHVRDRRRVPTTTEFIYWVHQHRKRHGLPGDTARLHKLIRLGNLRFWVLEMVIDERGKRIQVLPLQGRKS